MFTPTTNHHRVATRFAPQVDVSHILPSSGSSIGIVDAAVSRPDTDRYPFERLVRATAAQLVADADTTALHSAANTEVAADAAILERLVDRVELRLSQLLLRPMVTALNTARRTRRLGRRSSSAEGYERFIDDCLNVGVTQASGLEMSLLSDAQTAIVEREIAAVAEIIHRVGEHRELLTSTFGAGERLIDIGAQRSSAHHDGRSITVLEFDNGVKVVYKPRPVTGDAAFDQLARAVNTRFEASITTGDAVDCGGFGFAAFVNRSPNPPISDYFAGLGEIAALSMLLGQPALLLEDVISSPSGPVLVDASSVLGSSPIDRRVAVDALAELGVMPTTQRSITRFDTVDLGFPRAHAPLSTARLVDPYTDHMLLRFDDTAPLYWPDCLSGVDADAVAGCGRLMAESYQRLTTRILDDRNWWVETATASFADAETRYAHRPDHEYARRLQRSWSARALSDADYARAARQFDDPTGVADRGILESEDAQLVRYDMPTFFVSASGTDICDPDGATTGATVPRPPIDALGHRIDRLSTSDVANAAAAIATGFVSPSSSLHRRAGAPARRRTHAVA